MADPTKDPEAEDFVKQVEACYTRGRDQSSPWRKDAREEFAMVASDQWTDEDKALMQAKRRPMTTFNRMAPIINAVCGQEANGRHETKFSPRGLEDTGLAETLHATDRWSNQECDAEHEEAESFRDSLICGMGWTEDRMDFDLDPDGMWVRERVDPLEMYWDPSARKKNLTDARWLLRRMAVDLDALLEKFPNLPEQATGDLWMATPAEDDFGDGHQADQAWRYEFGREGQKFGSITAIVYQWYVLETEYQFVANGTTQTWTADQFSKVESRFKKANIPYVKRTQRVYYSALLARGVELERKKLGYAGFTYHCITGYRDRNKRCFYGMARDMKDPQRWANVVFSSMLRIMQKNSKGGLLAEIGAFPDVRKAEETWSSPDEITFLNNGALQGKRVQPKPASDYPSSLDKLLTVAITSMRDTSGVNVEMLGIADRDQPGIVEVQRKQSALAILAPFFDALRSYRKAAGRCKLAFIRKYFTDEMIVRAAGQKAQMYLPLIRDEKALRFDIEVEESPTSTNAKEQAWMVLSQITPALAKVGILPPPEALRYLPLPTELVDAWLKDIQTKAQDPARQMQQQIAMQQQQADVFKTQTQGEANRARAQKAMQPDNTMVNAQIDMAKAKFDLWAEMQRLQMEARQMGLELQFRAAEHEMDMRQQAQEHAMGMVQSAQDHQVALAQGEQQHQQQMAINEQAGQAKIQQMKAQAKAKPKPNGAQK